MSPSSLPNAVVPDANVLVAICSKEALTFQIAKNEFDQYVRDGWEFFAPNIIVAEVLYVLCGKLANGILTGQEHEKAVEFYMDLMTAVSAPENGEASLIKRAEEIRESYGCSRASDSLYIALAEDLAKTRQTEILTFDKGFINQATKNAPTVQINLLTI